MITKLSNILSLLLLLTPIQMWAQSTTIFGHVYDMDKKPVCTIVHVADTDARTVTDSTGYFEIKDQKRPGLFLPATLVDSWGDPKHLIVGKVLGPDSIPAAGAIVRLLNNVDQDSICKCDSAGMFYFQSNKLPLKIQIDYVGCNSYFLKITKKNVKKYQIIQLKYGGAL